MNKSERIASVMLQLKRVITWNNFDEDRVRMRDDHIISGLKIES